mmetsp:Transcript_113576/g.196887  ORF Transcript_113576/g.196887 Transcript_113576/m.196887 type:complete len:275 (+) Transcript_113576:126-950(+)
MSLFPGLDPNLHAEIAMAFFTPLLHKPLRAPPSAVDNGLEVCAYAFACPHAVAACSTSATASSISCKNVPRTQVSKSQRVAAWRHKRLQGSSLASDHFFMISDALFVLSDSLKSDDLFIISDALCMLSDTLPSCRLPSFSTATSAASASVEFDELTCRATGPSGNACSCSITIFDLASMPRRTTAILPLTDKRIRCNALTIFSMFELSLLTVLLPMLYRPFSAFNLDMISLMLCIISISTAPSRSGEDSSCKRSLKTSARREMCKSVSSACTAF